MITRIEAKNYKSLFYIDRGLSSFHVLVGPNASGKTTFMDVVSFLADIVRSGVDFAISSRTNNYTDLTFASKGGDIELALEVRLPANIKDALNNRYELIRYEICLGLSEETQEHIIKEERVILLNPDLINSTSNQVNDLFLPFPEAKVVPTTLLNKKYPGKPYREYQKVVTKSASGNDNFYEEINTSSGKGWSPSFKLGPKRSALANLPADESKFPAATWLKEFFLDGVQLFVLDSLNIRQASPPGQPRKFKPDGSNLPWVIHELRKNAKQYAKWLAHIQTALPDVVGIDSIERLDDKHRYLKVEYSGNLQVPSWLVSDGTLRLLALTLPAYLTDFSGVYLIEEPENGIHPKAVETVFQSLSSVYAAQIMLASHSPVVLSLVDRSQVLCFAKTVEGITDIVNGQEHPALQQWSGETNLGVLFASGILG